jgi:hypothetical protein
MSGVRASHRVPNYVTLAQLVEHLPEEQGVLGSIPRGGTKFVVYD